ncbi:MAG: hypothetical protein FD164_2193 [Nitrospirae bacterium]|nr:MAG: hypothetical protein FD164_2193 [Nitrospirota bacterium]
MAQKRRLIPFYTRLDKDSDKMKPLTHDIQIRNLRISSWLIRTEAEKPLSYQLLISNVRELAPAVDALHKLQADAAETSFHKRFAQAVDIVNACHGET